MSLPLKYFMVSECVKAVPRYFVLLDQDRRYIEGNSEPWSLVEYANALDNDLPVFMSDFNNGTRQVGIVRGP